jgi:hypothetical protein
LPEEPKVASTWTITKEVRGMAESLLEDLEKAPIGALDDGKILLC